MAEKNRYKNNKKHERTVRWARRSRANGGMPKEHKSGSIGYVYIFDIRYNGLYKVGMAGNWQSRLKDLQASNPNVKMVVAVRVSDARECERHLHKSFAKVHFERELFRLTYDHISYAEKYLNENSPKNTVEPIPIKQNTPPGLKPLTGWLSRRKEDIPNNSAPQSA